MEGMFAQAITRKTGPCFARKSGGTLFARPKGAFMSQKILLAVAVVWFSGTGMMAKNTSTPVRAPKTENDTRIVTVTGCLEQNHDGFRLKDTSGTDAPKSRNWKTGFLTKHSRTITIVDSGNRLKLGSHVGQRVSVGRMAGGVRVMVGVRVIVAVGEMVGVKVIVGVGVIVGVRVIVGVGEMVEVGVIVGISVGV